MAQRLYRRGVRDFGRLWIVTVDGALSAGTRTTGRVASGSRYHRGELHD
jgi:hypothetical protein